MNEALLIIGLLILLVAIVIAVALYELRASQYRCIKVMEDNHQENAANYRESLRITREMLRHQEETTYISKTYFEWAKHDREQVALEKVEFTANLAEQQAIARLQSNELTDYKGTV